jgi:hypothetical protein
MSNYRILKFKNNQGDVITWDGDNTGLFTHTGANNSKVHLFFLLSKPQSYKIFEIKRLSDNYIFRQGASLNNLIIMNFQILVSGDFGMFMSNGNTAYSNVVINVPTPPQPVVTPNFWSNLETLIISKYPRPIRIQGLLKKHQGHTGRKETPLQFLVKFFKEWNEEKNTIYVDNSEVQTDTGRRRSLGDIFMIMKYYYPTITLKEVFKLLHTDINTVITSGFRSSRCSQIQKRVWYYDSSSQSNVLDKSINDEYGNSYQKYVDNL